MTRGAETRTARAGIAGKVVLTASPFILLAAIFLLRGCPS